MLGFSYMIFSNIMEQLYHLGIKALVSNQAGKFLILKVNPEKLRNTDAAYWDIPGGRVQINQTIEDTLIREVFEETGLQVSSIGKNLGTFLSNILIPIEEGSVALLLSVYQVDVAEGNVLLSDEHTEMAWVDSESLIDRLRHKYPDGFLKLLSR